MVELRTYIAVSYLSINRCLSGGRNRIDKNKERNYVCNKSKVFFLSFFVVRQKTGKLVTSGAVCVYMSTLLSRADWWKKVCKKLNSEKSET